MKTKPPFKSVYGSSLALLTDLYELTMAYGYWKSGMADREAAFHLSFRKKPFQGEYAIAAGLETLIHFIEEFRFDESDLLYLSHLKDESGQVVFESAFIDYLEKLTFTFDIDAMVEGTLAFPYEPLIRITGPILQAQILESAILNIINFQSLIATKASRVCWAARQDPVIEFGLRRAQGIDGAISASRAAYIGGCHGTSNVMAGKLFNIPVKGTHAHSWIMAFDNELQAFYAYAEAMPRNCVFLIDTYDSIAGTKNAIQVAQKMRSQGYEMIGVRLDSGDLSYLSIEVRKLLDEAGFPNAKIMASNELDEFLIRDLKQQGAKVNIWGVGTNLVTGKEQPALDGVYKITAMKDEKGKWQDKIKISEQWAKVTTPGVLQVKRFSTEAGYIADMMYDISHKNEPKYFIDPFDPTHVQEVSSKWKGEDLLMPIMRKGTCVYKFPTLHEVREKTRQDLEKIPPSMRRFLNPQSYFVGMEKKLYERKLSLIQNIKQSFVP